MNIENKLPILAIFLSLSLWIFNKSGTSYQEIQGVCEKVLDGDTVIVDNQRVRLSLIDAPELKQVSQFHSKNGGRVSKIGELSKRILETLILGKEVRVYFEKKDRYGRVLGLIYYDERSISLEMLKLGGAVIYWFAKFKSSYQKELFYDALSLAKKEKRGMWNFPGFQDPYKYRKKLKRKSNRRRQGFRVSSN